MARKRIERAPETVPEFTEDEAQAPTEVIDDSAALVEQAPLAGSVKKEPPKGPPAPVPQLYRVTRGGRVMHRGALTELKVNKVVDERLYDIKRLREQGIALEPV